MRIYYFRLQRNIMYLLYGVLPQSSYAEAYICFQQAEELKPRFYIPNTCMLGKNTPRTCTQHVSLFTCRTLPTPVPCA